MTGVIAEEITLADGNALPIFGFELSEADMAEPGALDRTKGTDEARERKWW